MNKELYDIRDDVLNERELNGVLNSYMFHKDQLEGIHNFVSAKQAPWFVVYQSAHEDSLYFSHRSYDQQTITSEWFSVLGPILRELNPKSLVRVKANLYPRTKVIEEHGYHTDFPFECTTSIFYLNTNNGYTKFEDGTVIESISNRLLTIPTLWKHTGSSSTDEAGRISINVNYF